VGALRIELSLPMPRTSPTGPHTPRLSELSETNQFRACTFTLTLDVYGDYIPEQDGGAFNNLPEPTAPVQPAEKKTSNVVPLRR
jgi:hypothetical protein